MFKVVVDFPLDRSSPDFGEDLLSALNLLQENVGAADILPRDAAHDELLSTLDLAWKVSPPGTVDEVVRRTLRGLGRPTPVQEAIVRERIALFCHSACKSGSDSLLVKLDGGLRFSLRRITDGGTSFQTPRASRPDRRERDHG